jgi:hypothetical protein
MVRGRGRGWVAGLLVGGAAATLAFVPAVGGQPIGVAALKVKFEIQPKGDVPLGTKVTATATVVSGQLPQNAQFVLVGERTDRTSPDLVRRCKFGDQTCTWGPFSSKTPRAYAFHLEIWVKGQDKPARKGRPVDVAWTPPPSKKPPATPPRAKALYTLTKTTVQGQTTKPWTINAAAGTAKLDRFDEGHVFWECFYDYHLPKGLRLGLNSFELAVRCTNFTKAPILFQIDARNEWIDEKPPSNAVPLKVPGEKGFGAEKTLHLTVPPDARDRPDGDRIVVLVGFDGHAIYFEYTKQ